MKIPMETDMTPSPSTFISTLAFWFASETTRIATKTRYVKIESFKARY